MTFDVLTNDYWTIVPLDNLLVGWVRATAVGNRPRRHAPGHARHAHSEDPDRRAGARTHDRPRHRTELRRRAAGRTWIALSGAPSSRGSRADRRLLGHVRKQPQGQVLPDHAERPETSDRREEPLAAAR